MTQRAGNGGGVRAVCALASGALVVAALIGHGCSGNTTETQVPAPDAGSGAAPDAGGIGAACISPSESSPSFGGFVVYENAIETSTACASGLCLINHFQGRVSCPLGQAAPAPCTDAGSAGCMSADCQTASASAEENAGKPCCAEGSNTVVSTAVCGQCSDRSAAEDVYCSCRCAPAPGDPEADAGTYCTCPDGFTCTLIRQYVGGPGPDYSGSYCIKPGTEYTVLDAATMECGTVLGYSGDPTCAGN